MTDEELIERLRACAHPDAMLYAAGLLLQAAARLEQIAGAERVTLSREKTKCTCHQPWMECAEEAESDDSFEVATFIRLPEGT